MSKIEFPQGKRIHPRVLEAQIEDNKLRLEMGAIGRLVGRGAEKPANIAVFAIIVSCVMMVFVAWLPVSEPNFPRRELLLALAQVIPTALGFLFGKAR